jgi:hypothetical protein
MVDTLKGLEQVRRAAPRSLVTVWATLWVKAKLVDKEEHGTEESTMICRGEAGQSPGTHARVMMAITKA